MQKSARHQIRVAVVGGGAFGECHLKTYASMPQVEIAGLFTLDAARGRTLCQTYGGRVYGSLAEIASDSQIDLVSIVTPEDAHFEAFDLLARHGKAVYVEKPLATSLEQAEAMVAQSQNVLAMCGHCLRFESRLAHVFSRRAELGRVRHMSFKNRRPRSQKAIYGRSHPAFVLLCHEMDLANAFAGRAFERVCGVEINRVGETFDGISVLIDFGQGTTCNIEGGWVLPDQSAVPEHDEVILDFDRGTFSIVLPSNGISFLGEGGLRSINQQYEHSVYGLEFGALRAALDYMVNCVIERKRPEISTIEDGYNAVRLAEAAIRSVAQNGWVRR